MHLGPSSGKISRTAQNETHLKVRFSYVRGRLLKFVQNVDKLYTN